MNNWLFRRDDKPTRAFRWLFLLSATALAGLLSVKGDLIWIAFSIPLVLVALIFLVFRFHFLEKTFSSLQIGRAALSIVLAAYAAQCYSGMFLEHLRSFAAENANPLFSGLIDRFGAAGSLVAGLVSVLALFVYLYWFIGWFSARMLDVFRRLDAVERWYLVVALTVSVVLLVVLYQRTSVFCNPNASADNVWSKVDILYSSDTSSLTEQNVFYNIAASENDIRQPLFGAFAAPFALSASLITRLLLLPGAYYTLLQIVQAALLFVSLVLVARMTGVSGAEKALLLALLTLLFPTLLFLLNMEQYIFSVFWLVLLVWLFMSHDAAGRDVAWIAATGSIATSGLFLVLVPGSGSLRERFKQAALAVVRFGVIALLLGRAAMAMTSVANIRFLLQFAGEKLPFLERLMQYIRFAASCFVAPAGEVLRYESGMAVYHQAAVSGWSIGGIVCIVSSIAGFLLNRKSAYARVCAFWVACSFLLLCVAGWGTSENGLVLYTLYFAWAFVSLLVLLVTKLFQRAKALRLGAFSAGIIALVLLNARGIAEIVRFGLQYYPKH